VSSAESGGVTDEAERQALGVQDKEGMVPPAPEVGRTISSVCNQSHNILSLNQFLFWYGFVFLLKVNSRQEAILSLTLKQLIPPQLFSLRRTVVMIFSL